MDGSGWLGRARTAFGTMLDAAFPAACVACGRTGFPVCDACIGSIPAAIGPTCVRCGAPAPPGAPRLRCDGCRSGRDGVPRTRTAGSFEGTLRVMIHAFKYRDRPDAASRLATLLVGPARDVLGGAMPLVVPVPLHPSRADERGYDQAALLARHLGEFGGWPVRHAIARVRATPSQVGLGLAARRSNVANAFVATGRLDGERVLLVDDVMTTGATLADAARAIRAAGAASVVATCLARNRATRDASDGPAPGGNR